MPSRPRLVPAPQTRGADVDLQSTPFWIGAAADSGLRILLPGMAPRHVSLLEREDGWWISPARADAPPRVNGDTAPAPRRLRHGDLLEFAPGVVYRFDTGQAPPPALAPRVRAPALVALAAPPPPRTRQGGLVDRHTRRRRWLWRGAVAGALALVIAAVVVAVSALRREAKVDAPLSEADAVYLDSLMLSSSERVERGTALLALGAADPALREFAGAVNQLETSRLGANPWVRPRIANLEAAIAAVYREKRIAVPPRYQAARPATRASSAGLPRGALTPEQFAAAVEEAQKEFEARYGRRIIVTGRDHGEHMMLYGPGGALDMRVRDLTREQLVFGMDALRRRGVRVKDFSDDRVLQAQIESARRRNRPDLMGTGLHLHIDRFANRWDRWTTYK
ncbi:FHA domain-containing protein [Longimicrobium sp.]|uniref:FHA domain-containing protein n=1 Tax=Longimicrobium sp. TaxID=2029185 RepID=UPI003B39FE8E